MNVAMVDPSLFTGRYDDSMCAAIAAQGHQVTLFGRPLRTTDALSPVGYAYASRYFRIGETLRPMIGEGKAFRAIKAAEYMIDCIAGSKPLADVVHYQWLPFAPADRHILARLRSAGVPLVHTVHNASAYHGDSGLQGRGYAGLLKQFDRLIVHGAPTRDALLTGGVDAGRIGIVPHPPMHLAPATAESRAHVPTPRAPRILFFGTIRPYKGLDLLVDACQRLWPGGTDFELAIAGKPFIDVDAMLSPVHASGYAGRLHCDLGFLEEARLSAWMESADIIVFPYRHIDSSGAFLSALHHGKAMVCTQTGLFASLPEEASGSPSVTLVPVDNVGALADALLPLIESAAIRRDMGGRAAALGARLGTWDKAGSATVAIYSEAQAAAAARRSSASA